ncbi:MAG: efflux RND transporter periplasmic adaptor subunit [Candidatus Edwardsbacteria bacterium]|nr:efflux RND transporter periplasmic adaptor subunit [Candidatus Edwardsbacteria bacterium]MBU1577761.1 efflux RND transporter periplasmic adaptor subunit [Candidatus Edwardsbacteria bacterium]MBU2463118.1 efflux RND transporter periplasmic adaptor subunit [Candidatus Edwardsbacteria bacterium]MBU2594707.1 efflux RND transporter periplasmic adaptor subunit [Candidatus Edwardsbacteria bacterium]
MKRKNTLILSAVILVIMLVIMVVIAGRIIAKNRGSRNQEAVVNRSPVEVATIVPTDYDETLELSGTMMAENQIEVPSKVSGKIIKYLFEEGAWIEAGQSVVSIDRDEVGVEFKEAVLESPIAGWLTKRYFDTGARVNPGTPLFQVADYRKVKLLVSVPESDMSKLKAGAKVAANIDAWPKTNFTGFVKKISPTVDYLSRTVKAEISVGNQGLKLRPGMYGRAVINVRHYTKGVVIPTSAIIEREVGKLVFVLKGNKAVARNIEVELDLGDRTAVKSGLSLGEELIISGQHSVTDGSPVEVVGGK